ncbi:hypothetical protein CYMTET_2652 [Cymbomonas tetramitiformis]|uniref:Uncharacterized protein n=1 Tax=Cymbomonas tetramitiformis TaxID=36881 RepID=A0AAE0LLT2_9CHLO|nr:hypothetical protein CYMTET_2652 [Cymbomonas tetramitiformis]
MTATAPESTALAAAVKAYSKPDAAEWLAFMTEHAAEITPMYQRINVNDGEDDGTDTRASQRKRKRAAALTDEAASLEGLKASITPPLIDVLRIVQQANLVRTGVRPPRAYNGVNVATVNEGMSPSIRGHAEHGGHVLREYLTPREYDLFERTGVSPAERRPCLLCMRSQIHYAHMCMVHNMQDMPNSAILLNSYVNPRDEEDGYDGQYMIPRTDTPIFQGLAGSVCVSEKHLLRWIVKDNVHRIDQSALRYRAEDRMRLHNVPAAEQLF